jgi:poly-gamma-glutamate capsule biosynthesis protein CapA/YwtB (metallophosphatase superfamily)
MTESDPARARFFIITAMRFFGVGAIFFGVAVIAKRWFEPAEIVGGVFILFGLTNMLVVPAILVKAWRTPQ